MNDDTCNDMEENKRKQAGENICGKEKDVKWTRSV